MIHVPVINVFQFRLIIGAKTGEKMLYDLRAAGPGFMAKFPTSYRMNALTD